MPMSRNRMLAQVEEQLVRLGLVPFTLELCNSILSIRFKCWWHRRLFAELVEEEDLWVYRELDSRPIRIPVATVPSLLKMTLPEEE